MGPIEQNIIKQAMRSGQPIPDRIVNAPELQNCLYLYLQAFFDLDCERSHAFGPSPIPWTSINDYANAFNFDQEQKDDLFYFIRQMDGKHLEKLRQKQR